MMVLRRVRLYFGGHVKKKSHLTDNIQVHEASLEPELLQLLTQHSTVVLDLDTHRSYGPCAHLDTRVTMSSVKSAIDRFIHK